MGLDGSNIEDILLRAEEADDDSHFMAMAQLISYIRLDILYNISKGSLLREEVKVALPLRLLRIGAICGLPCINKRRHLHNA